MWEAYNILNLLFMYPLHFSSNIFGDFLAMFSQLYFARIGVLSIKVGNGDLTFALAHLVIFQFQKYFRP